MAGVQRLQKIKRFGSPHFAHHDSIGSVPKCRADKIRDRHRRQRLFLAERDLRSPCLEAEKIRLIEMDLCRLFNEDDSIAIGNVGGQGVEEGRLASPGPA